MAKKHNKRYVCDFETSTPEFYEIDGYARVWAWALVDIDNTNHITYGNEINSLFFKFENSEKDLNIWFHNLKFDGQYILWHLMYHNFKWVKEEKDKKVKPEPNTFSTVITDMGQWYQIRIYYEDHKITIRDSLKLYNMSVDEIAKSLGFDEQKLSLDYAKYRPVGYELMPYEVDYIAHDVIIVAKALKILFDSGHTKMTTGANSLALYKKMTPKFKEWFPELSNEEDSFVRASYKGGFTFLNSIHANKYYRRKGVVFDYNSLYPSILHDELLPYGEGVKFEGQYMYDNEYPLYVQKLTCDFELKEGKIPSIQLKHNMDFKPNEYIVSSNGIPQTLYLTKPDLELFFEQYEVYDLEYEGGYKYQGKYNMFTHFIDKLTEDKIRAKKEGNKGQYMLAKVSMNSLYGKLGSSPIGSLKTPNINASETISYTNFSDDSRHSIYCPVASFCTAYGRKRIIEASQFIRDWTKEHYGEDRYIYSDTDSIHAFLSKEDVECLKNFLEIDDYKLGALKLESEFTSSKYLRQKCYMELMTDGNLNVTIAGLPKKLAPIMNFRNFQVGFSTKDLPKEYLDSIGYKLTYKQVKGGVLLVNTDFTIK